MPGSKTLASNDPKSVLVLAGRGKGAPSTINDTEDNAKSESTTSINLAVEILASATPLR